MLIAYELHMAPSSTTPHPSRSWKEKRFIRVRRYRKDRAPDVAHHHHRWSDGWSCSVSMKVVDGAEARKLRKESAGFAGYDWMITSIEEHGEIRT